MTREEAIKALSLMEHVESIAAAYGPGECRQGTTVRELKEACRMASEALCTQQAHTKLNRRRWEGCWSYNNQKVRNLGLRHGREYCPCCGKHLTGQAWAELERRIGGNDGTTD